MPHHLLDLSLLLQIIQRLPCETAIDLQSVHERSDCDEAVGLNVFVKFVGGGFVEDDGVVGLVLDYRKRQKSARAYRQRFWAGRGDTEGLGMERGEGMKA